MATGDVKTNLVDGGLGFSTKGADGIHCKIGTAEGGEVNKVYSVSSYPEAKAILKNGKLLESIEQWYKEFDSTKKQDPPKLFFVVPDRDIPGQLSSPVLFGNGNAIAQTSGSPTGSRKFIFEIIKGGTSGEATYRKSNDGGLTYSGEIITPLTGIPISMGGGCNIVFNDGSPAVDSFMPGDRWEFTSEEPGASVISVTSAIEKLRTEYAVRFIHVLGETDPSFWTACNELAENWSKDYKHHIFFVFETKKRTTETVEDWVLDRVNESKSFSGKRVMAVCMSGLNNLNGKHSNLANVLTAKLSASRVHESPGFVDKFGFLTITQLDDYEKLSERVAGKSFLDTLDDNNYTVALSYDDYPGFFFSHANTFADDSSDFQRIQILRCADKIRRISRNRIMRFLESPSHPEAGIGGILSLIAEIDNALGDAMEKKGDREIDSHKTNIDENQDVLGLGKVEGSISFVPIGTMEAIELNISTAKA